MHLDCYEAFDVCRISKFKHICLAPLIVLFVFLIFFLSIRNFLPDWLFCGLFLGGISGLLGRSKDIYWIFLIRKFDRNWVMFDYGKYADVFSLEDQSFLSHKK